jgi:hypothetical protein
MTHSELQGKMPIKQKNCRWPGNLFRVSILFAFLRTARVAAKGKRWAVAQAGLKE